MKSNGEGIPSRKLPLSGQEAAANEREKLAWVDIAEVETSKGSLYRYLSDGTSQRFKVVEGKEYEPDQALVYVPDYEWVKANAPAEMVARFGENESIYEEVLLNYVNNPQKDGHEVYIVDQAGKKVETNKDIAESDGLVFLAFSKNGKPDFNIPISRMPRLGYATFDTRTYRDEETGNEMRERHLGNRVVKIKLKNGTVIE